MKNIRERNLAILRESKKKKNTTKELENKTVENEKDLTALRVKNGILEKEYALLKTVVDQKALYIKQLEDATGPGEETDQEVISDQGTPNLMNKDTQDHRCNACDRAFATSQDLNNHIEAKHNQQVCVFCEKVCTNDQQLKRHITQCVEYGNTTVKCDNCDKTLTRFGMKRHGESCKRSTKVWACPDCGFQARTSNDIKKHQNEKHNEVEVSREVWACPDCGFRARSSNDIKKHQNDKHNEVEVSREVCKHWRNGNCFRADRCKFSHVGVQRKQTSPSTTGSSTANKRTAACRHGDKCSWFERGICSYFHKGVGFQKPAAQMQHGIISNEQGSQAGKLCHYNNKCNRRSTCPHRHTSPSNENFQSQRRHHQPPLRLQNSGRFNQ